MKIQLNLKRKKLSELTFLPKNSKSHKKKNMFIYSLLYLLQVWCGMKKLYLLFSDKKSRLSICNRTSTIRGHIGGFSLREIAHHRKVWKGMQRWLHRGTEVLFQSVLRTRVVNVIIENKDKFFYTSHFHSRFFERLCVTIF